jgi:hypothetical protein
MLPKPRREKTMRKVLLLGVLALAACTAAPTIDPRPEQLAWIGCTSHYASDHAGSCDSADTVAIAALMACQDHQWAYQRALITHVLHPMAAAKIVQDEYFDMDASLARMVLGMRIDELRWLAATPPSHRTPVQAAMAAAAAACPL